MIAGRQIRARMDINCEKQEIKIQLIKTEVGNGAGTLQEHKMSGERELLWRAVRLLQMYFSPYFDIIPPRINSAL